jgi:hypothetical protein
MYRMLRRLNISFTEGFGGFFFPSFKLIFGVYVVSCAYGTTKLLHSGDQPLVLFVLAVCASFMFGAQVVIFRSAAEVYELSSSISSKGKGNCLRKEDRILLRSFVPFAVRIGPFYVVKTGTPLSYLSAIICYTISFLIG